MRYSGSDDSQAGKGSEKIASLFYQKKEFNVYASYQAASDRYLPKLGFFPEIDYKGPQFSASYQKTIVKGPIQGYNIGSDYTNYQHFDGGFYRRDWDLNGYLTFRHGPAFSYLLDLPNFEGQKDRFQSAGVTYPNDNPYRQVSAGADWGTQAELPYHTYKVGGKYRLMGKLDLGLTYQALFYQGYSDQIIGTLNYDMGHDRAISGRVVKQNDKLNPYIAFRRSGNAGMEYYLVVGDPNALQFRSSIILKVTYPIERVLKG